MARWHIEVHRRSRLQRVLESFGLLESPVGIREHEFWARARALEDVEPGLDGTHVLEHAYHEVRLIRTRWGERMLYAITLEACPYWSEDLEALFIVEPSQASFVHATGRHGVLHLVGYCRSSERETEIEAVEAGLG